MASYGTVVSFPIPAYANVPIQPEYYQPSRFVISAIAQGQTTTITAAEDMNYVIGQYVRLIIPKAYGAYGLNGIAALVIDLPDTDEVTLLIDSTNMDAFIPSPTIPAYADTSLPQILAIGDSNSGQINASGRSNLGTFIPGSFENISPL